jgi:hypothetical protein
MKITISEDQIKTNPTYLDIARFMSRRAFAERVWEVQEARASIRKLNRGRRQLRRYVSLHLPGRKALTEITRIEKLSGPYGARTWFERFLAEHRAGPAPEGIRASDWLVIAQEWARKEVDGLLLETKVGGEIILVERVAFFTWKARGFDHLTREEPIGCPDLIYKPLPRGFWPKQGQTSNAPKKTGAPDVWDSDESEPIHWTDSEKAKGLHKSIPGENYFEGKDHISNALARQLAKDHWDQRADLKTHKNTAIGGEMKFSAGPWKSPILPKKEASEIQGEVLEAEADEAEETLGRDVYPEGPEGPEEGL